MLPRPFRPLGPQCHPVQCEGVRRDHSDRIAGGVRGASRFPETDTADLLTIDFIFKNNFLMVAAWTYAGPSNAWITTYPPSPLNLYAPKYTPRVSQLYHNETRRGRGVGVT